MNKRTLKKKHKEYLWDVMYEVSLARQWRETLFMSAEHRTFSIDATYCAGFSSRLRRGIIAGNLRYTVYREHACRDELGNALIPFVVHATRFPAARICSYNNPDA